MKKTKLLMPLVSIAALGSVAAPIAALTSCSKTQVLTYDEAKEWVKTNYGEKAKDATIAKTESSWSFGGWVTIFGSGTSAAGTRTGWLYGHLENMLAAIAGVPTSTIAKTEVDKTGATGGTSTKCALGDIAFTTDLLDDKKIVTEDEITHKTLAYDNFDKFLDDYFFGIFKHNADYVVNGKSLTISGVFSYTKSRITEHNFDNLKMPGINVKFDSQGRLTNVWFDFKENTTCSYQWQTGTSSDGYTFEILASSYIKSEWTYKAE